MCALVPNRRGGCCCWRIRIHAIGKRTIPMPKHIRITAEYERSYQITCEQPNKEHGDEALIHLFAARAVGCAKISDKEGLSHRCYVCECACACKDICVLAWVRLCVMGKSSKRMSHLTCRECITNTPTSFRSLSVHLSFKISGVSSWE